MRRRFGLIPAFSLLLLAACGPDSALVSPNPADSAGPGSPQRATAPTPGTCTTPENLLALVDTVFGTGSPNYNSARGKTDNLIKQVRDGNLPAAQDQAYNIVEFVLKLWRGKGLEGTEEQTLRLINAVYCYAGVATTASDADNSWLIYPTDLPQVIVSTDLLAGIKLPAEPVFEPSLLTITRIDPAAYPLGSGPLETKLDQYPGFYDFDLQSANDLNLARPAIVAVCLLANIPTEVADRLRLGHQRDAGPQNFEITPVPDPTELDFLACPDPSTYGAHPGWIRKAADLFLPKPLFAAAMYRSGGVGGTAGELSPFAPVDTRLSGSGGVGGTAGELIRMPAPGEVLSLSSLGESCEPLEAPIGTELAAACRPSVTISTRLGTVLQDVPVTWAVTAGGGVVAVDLAGADPDCGTFGSSASATTNAAGVTRACWRMGSTPGVNTLTATPSAGGDAPYGVTFEPPFLTFIATATTPSQMVFETQPASITAGAPIAFSVSARDHAGRLVEGWSGSATASISGGTFASGATTTSFVNGIATFGPLVIESAGEKQVTVTATFPPPPPATTPVVATVTSVAFTVSPAAAVAIRIVAGDGQTAPAGSATPVAPVVGVRDRYGNDVPNESVTWTATLSSGSTAVPALSSTDAAGLATTTWTLGPDANQLVARIASLPDSSVTFNATGTVTLNTVNSCPVGGSGDPFNDPAKPYGFWIPNPGNNKAVRQVTLYISSAGKANLPTEYLLALDTRVGAWSNPAQTTLSRVTLRGNNAESKAVTFVLAQPVVGSGGGPDVFMRLRVHGANPDGAILTFNTGPCPPGKSCRPPSGCSVTEVTTFPSYGGTGPVPTGEAYRKSVAIVVKG